jgi:ribosomal 30S subunit maturation factor RimM
VVRNGKERWLPATASVIREVDLEAGVIRVDWDADF